MSDRFHPISMEQLTAWIFTELNSRDSLFGIPRAAFFVPGEQDRFRLQQYGHPLDTPFGVAAGPHSQMAQNIVVAWACGARFLELKTVQTLDELDVHKPCIDLEDEGYNVEWSQELRVHESFDEYLRAWVLIHALHHKLGFRVETPGMIFNMSVGYDLQGILEPNVQWFLDVMRDCSTYKQAYVDIVSEWYPEIRDLEIPDMIADSVTLSTMHGCPPHEIERICAYLLQERGLHTSVKCNPTLLGAREVRSIVNEELGYRDVVIPDEAFAQDLQFDDAVSMIQNLRRLAGSRGLVFGVKLTNTLEVENFRQVFDRDERMYMSGRALHAVSTNLALRLSENFDGELPISFAGGADCFNVADLLRCGMVTVTVCSDLLKSGGYMRMLQYFETLEAAMDRVDAADLFDFIGKSARLILTDSVSHEAGTASLDRLSSLALVNLRQYAAVTRSQWRLNKDAFRTSRSKTTRRLELFDCIEAPCIDECPIDQKVPQYMQAVRRGDFRTAVTLTREDNPLPTILGRVCDHLCENTCIRTHLDEPLAIREIKRFIMAQEGRPELFEQAPASGEKVAIIGAGPAGLSAAQLLAYGGFAVTIFEMYPYAGGMVGGAIPVYRLPQSAIDQDLAVLQALGVEIRYDMRAGVDFTLAELQAAGFDSVFVAVGAQLARKLGLSDEDADGVMDALSFLRSVREGEPLPIGPRVAVIGAGDTAMDCVRTAYRLGAEVTLIYRRTLDQMPADREEIRAALEEGVEIIELAKPQALKVERGRLEGLVCRRMEYRGERDGTGRKVPRELPGSEFEKPLDTLILAISQDAVLDFFGDRLPEVNSRGFLEVDPSTCETSLSGVYAGGDVAADGPSSIVEATADGKRVAESIMARTARRKSIARGEQSELDVAELLQRRAHRAWRVSVGHTPLDERMSFAETVLTYTAEQAMKEAKRCLDCHQMCSLCVGVCPNLALMTYRSQGVELDLPTLEVLGGELRVGERERFRASEKFQIAVLTDLCNECGNCTTFCPTAGEPYRDKPRLYLDREDFESQRDNAFMLIGNGRSSSLEARWRGQTHRIELAGEIRYTSPAFSARLEAETLVLRAATVGQAAREGQVLSLRPCATMYVLLRGLSESMPQLPQAMPPGSSGRATRIIHPGYEE